jgi:hypothetical protein
MGQFISEMTKTIFVKIPLGIRIAGEIDSIALFFTALPKNDTVTFNQNCSESRYLEENYYNIQLSFEIVIFILSTITLIIFSIFFNLSKRNNEDLKYNFTIVNMIISAICLIFGTAHLSIINNVFAKCKTVEKIDQYYPIIFNFVIFMVEYCIDLFNILKPSKIKKEKKIKSITSSGSVETRDSTIERIILSFGVQNIEKKKTMINKLKEKKRKLEEKYREVEMKYNEVETLNYEIYKNNEQIEQLKSNLELLKEYEPELTRIRTLKERKKKEIHDILSKNDEAEKLILTWSSISNDVTRLTKDKDILRKKNDILKLQNNTEQKKLKIKQLKETLDNLKKEKKKIENEYIIVQNINNENNSYEKKIKQIKEFLQQYTQYETQFTTIRQLKSERDKEINDIKNNPHEEIIFEWATLTNQVARLQLIKDSMRR